MTELQKHVSFFDRNKDGILTPLETFQGAISLLTWFVGVHLFDYPFFSIYFCTLDDTQDLLLSDVKLPSPVRLHQQFILLSLLSPTLYVRSLSFIYLAVSKFVIKTRNASFFPLVVFLLVTQYKINNAAWCTATLRQYLRGVHPQSNSWKRHRCLRFQRKVEQMPCIHTYD